MTEKTKEKIGMCLVFLVPVALLSSLTTILPLLSIAQHQGTDSTSFLTAIKVYGSLYSILAFVYAGFVLHHITDGRCWPIRRKNNV